MRAKAVSTGQVGNRLVDLIELEWVAQRDQAKTVETIAIQAQEPVFNAAENKRHKELSVKFDFENLPNKVNIAVKNQDPFDPLNSLPEGYNFWVQYKS